MGDPEGVSVVSLTLARRNPQQQRFSALVLAFLAKPTRSMAVGLSLGATVRHKVKYFFSKKCLESLLGLRD